MLQVRNASELSGVKKRKYPSLGAPVSDPVVTEFSLESSSLGSLTGLHASELGLGAVDVASGSGHGSGPGAATGGEGSSSGGHHASHTVGPPHVWMVLVALLCEFISLI